MSLNPEDIILAQNLKSEKTAVPVNITVAVDQGRIDPNEFMDDGMKALEESVKNDVKATKDRFNQADKFEKEGKLRMKRRDNLKNGHQKPRTKEDQGLFP